MLGLSLAMTLGNPTLNANGAWSPTDLGASLLAWWTADRADLITHSLGSVSSWKDVVGGYDAVQATGAAQPLYSATSFNGAPAVSYDGADDELTLAPIPAGIPTGTDPSEVWAVLQQSALPADTTIRNVLSYGSGTGGARRTVGRSVVSAVNRARIVSGNSVTSIDSTLTATVTDFSSRHVMRAEFGASGRSITVDGVAGGADAITLHPTDTTRLRLGASPNAPAGAFWHGLIRDIIITPPLTTEQAAALQAWALPRRMV